MEAPISWITRGYNFRLAAQHFFYRHRATFDVIGWSMDRQMVLDHLALAEQHITEGKIIIERQLTLIAKLEQGGHDTTGSRELLTQFLHTQKMHEEDRKRLRRELAKLEAEKPRNSS